MNRREKRNLEKRLGVTKHVKSLPRAERFERMRQNILEGKKKEDEMREVVRLQLEKKTEQSINSKVATIATDLMVKEGLSYIDALEKAKTLA